MTLVRLTSITCLGILLTLAFASGDAVAANPAQSVQTVYVDGLDKPVELPVIFPPVKKIPREPTEQELRTRAETGNIDAIEVYAHFLSSPSDFPWFLKAAEGGSPTATIIVANRAREGLAGYRIDQALSDKWSESAREIERQAFSRKDAKVLRAVLKEYAFSSGLEVATKAQYALVVGRAGGFEIEDGFDAVIAAFPDTPERVQLLQQCSNNGHPWCTSRLAYDHLKGNHGMVIDHALGVQLLTKVAQAGYQLGGDPMLAKDNFDTLSQIEQIQLMKTAIEHGAIDYAVSLAYAYRDGNGVQKSAPIAAALLQTFVQRPDAAYGSMKGNAIYGLASMYVDGKSLPVNERLFLQTFNLASSLDKSGREAVVEFLMIDGDGLLRNDTLNITGSTRLLLLKSAAEKSQPFNDEEIDFQYESALRLGDLYSSGQKVKQSYADAMTWYQKAEQIATRSTENHFVYDSGFVSGTTGGFNYDGGAAIKIGILYEKGLGVAKDSSTAMSWYQKAADDLISRSAEPSTLMKLVNSVQLPKESVDRVISFIRSSAEANNGEGQYYLGEMYYEGQYVSQSYSEAAGWFEKCASHSDNNSKQSDCLGTLGKMYLQGQGVTRDAAKAAYYYQQLFDTGWGDFNNTDVSDMLLPMYCGGEGIPIDRPKAFAIFMKYADQNVPFDELGIGAMYQMGWGVGQDLAEAFNWYRKAAADKNYSSAQAKADFTRIFRDCKATPENFDAAVSLYAKASGAQN